MTKDQKEEAKRTYLLNVKKSLILPAENSDELVNKIKFLHQKIGKLEAEKYDLEKRHERQEYDVYFWNSLFIFICTIKTIFYCQKSYFLMKILPRNAKTI